MLYNQELCFNFISSHAGLVINTNKSLAFIITGMLRGTPFDFRGHGSWGRVVCLFVFFAADFLSFFTPRARAVASLTVPGGQEFHFPHFFLKFGSSFLTFPQIFLIFFLILTLRVGKLPTREGPGYATASSRWILFVSQLGGGFFVACFFVFCFLFCSCFFVCFCFCFCFVFVFVLLYN